MSFVHHIHVRKPLILLALDLSLRDCMEWSTKSAESFQLEIASH
jgi:hypothetical protein